jgi:hypothetical protein
MTTTTDDVQDLIAGTAPFVAPEPDEAETAPSAITNVTATTTATQPPDGIALLDALLASLLRYVVLPSPAAADAITLWIAATHKQDAWDHAARLIIKSPLKRCGKTLLLEVVSETVHKPLRTVNISTAALVRSIDEADPPTLVLDEADTVFTQHRGGASEQTEALRGILNSGHARNWPYIRYNAASRQNEHCPTYAMAALGGIGDMPDTIEDRAVVVGMRRRTKGERVAPFRSRQAHPLLHEIRDQLCALAASITIDDFAELDVQDRVADTWESLIAIADAVGGNWPERARRACEALTASDGDELDEGGPSERLLNDLFAIFNPTTDDDPPVSLDPREKVPTPELLETLKDLDEAPWADWAGGKGLSARGLSQLLKPFRVKAKKWSGGTRGYLYADLDDAWARYRHPPASIRPSATDTGDPHMNTGDLTVADAVAEGSNASATVESQRGQAGSGDRGAVADDPEARLNGAQGLGSEEEVEKWDL